MATFFCKTGNTRVVKQSSLQKFQEEMETVMKDPYKVVMKQSKLPMSLLHDRIRPHVRWRNIPVEFLWQTPCRYISDIFVFCFPVESSGFNAVLMTFLRLDFSPLLGVSHFVSVSYMLSGWCSGLVEQDTGFGVGRHF